jgi:hypothetical protein
MLFYGRNHAREDPTTALNLKTGNYQNGNILNNEMALHVRKNYLQQIKYLSEDYISNRLDK